jgi:hypothetical protein
MWIAILLSIIFILKIFLNSNTGKGIIGELLVYKTLKKLNITDYHIFNNTILKSIDNTTTQIDHIVVSRFGIFVIETKYFDGWIYGRKKDKFWTQTFFKKKSRFQNPLHQNFKHTETLRKLINTEDIYSIIVFAGKGNLKLKDIENVLYLKELNSYIRNKKSKIISGKKKMEIIEIIQKTKLKRHII